MLSFFRSSAHFARCELTLDLHAYGQSCSINARKDVALGRACASTYGRDRLLVPKIWGEATDLRISAPLPKTDLRKDTCMCVVRWWCAIFSFAAPQLRILILLKLYPSEAKKSDLGGNKSVQPDEQLHGLCCCRYTKKSNGGNEGDSADLGFKKAQEGEPRRSEHVSPRKRAVNSIPLSLDASKTRTSITATRCMIPSMELSYSKNICIEKNNKSLTILLKIGFKAPRRSKNRSARNCYLYVALSCRARVFWYIFRWGPFINNLMKKILGYSPRPHMKAGRWYRGVVQATETFKEWWHRGRGGKLLVAVCKRGRQEEARTWEGRRGGREGGESSRTNTVAE